MSTEWIATKDKEPATVNDITFGANVQVKIVFTYEHTAYLGVGLFTKWNNGETEWAELCDDKNHFAVMERIPTHYIVLPEIP